jgi:hypothetical protein
MIGKYASLVRRFAVWFVAITLAIFAGSGVASLAPARGRAVLAVLLAALLVQAFVAVSVVTALESLFPALRPVRRRVRRS